MNLIYKQNLGLNQYMKNNSRSVDQGTYASMKNKYNKEVDQNIHDMKDKRKMIKYLFPKLIKRLLNFLDS